MTSLKLTAIGDATGVVLPQEILERLQVDRGDLLYVVETPLGIEFIPSDPEHARQVETAERIMREDRDVLRGLSANKPSFG